MKHVRIVSFWRVRDQRYLAKSPWELERLTTGWRSVGTKELCKMIWSRNRGSPSIQRVAKTMKRHTVVLWLKFRGLERQHTAEAG